jgi:hypothetical protein
MVDREPDRSTGSPRPVSARRRAGDEGRHRGFIEWIRVQPVLAAAMLGFCVVAIVGLVVSVPRGFWSGRSVGTAHVGTPAPSIPGVGLGAPDGGRGDAPGSARGGESGSAGPWVEVAEASTSPRGVSLGYRYRTLPTDSESRYEWMVQVRGVRSVLEAIDVVSWRMEPAAKNGADFVSRDRAADGFPLFGHGPGGWFGVSATIRYQDGGEETLARRIELSE